ncbi:hypothetical protein TNCV_2537101 [Trichonephila clavipes]|nr:hypothetical protein TNCV_2537101 [Trichonephila clavipes]
MGSDSVMSCKIKETNTVGIKIDLAASARSDYLKELQEFQFLRTIGAHNNNVRAKKNSLQIRNKGLPPPKVTESLKKNKEQRGKCLPKQEKPQIEAQISQSMYLEKVEL